MLGPDGTLSDLTERDLIARIQAMLPPAPPWVLVGIGDDAAVVEPERNRVDVLAVDAVVEAVHFDPRFTPPAAIGHRALAVNLSDLAAMGAVPRTALLSMVLPPSLPCADFDAIVSGLTTLAAAHGVQVVGGNITRSPGPLMLDVAVTGSVKRRGILRRSGARPGDEIYVTGTLGAASAGLQMLRARSGSDPGSDPGMGSTTDCVERYLYPQPRVRTGILLSRNRAATACMDLSDGLADGIEQIAAASGVGAIIDGAALPIPPEARRWFEAHGQDPVVEAARGGDDYELVLTVRPRFRRRLLAAARAGVALTRIGVCTAAPEVRLRRTDLGTSADEPLPTGYRHFR